MANGIKCGLQPCFNYMFGSTVLSSLQRAIGRTSISVSVYEACLYINVSLNKHRKA